VKNLAVFLLKNRYFFIVAMLIIIVAGFLIPEPVVIPVESANANDWNKDTFWYEPWGKSGVHKGIDIFAAKGAKVIATTPGMILYQGTLGIGGKVVVMLGPKWRLHYFAHLDEVNVHMGELVLSSYAIGKVGDSGNAKGKQPHLHYSIITLVPYFWNIDTSTQGWKKMFFLDPGRFLVAP
jgi:murein DD-endopeptidase MepM/ murein hydrolase activator NlpD